MEKINVFKTHDRHYDNDGNRGLIQHSNGKLYKCDE